MKKIKIQKKSHPFVIDMITVMKFEENTNRSFLKAFESNASMSDLLQMFYAAFQVGAADEGTEFPYDFTTFARSLPDWGIMPQMNQAFTESLGKLTRALTGGAPAEEQKETP